MNKLKCWCLEEHTDDRHHCKSSVGQFRIKFGFLHFWVIRCDELPSKVSSKGCSSRGLVLGNFAEGHVCQNLCPSCSWHFGDCGKAIGHICKLQASRRRQETREFACNFWGDVSHGCKHGNAAVLDFCRTTALEVLNTAVAGEPCWIPESDGSLDTELVLECTQRRSGVVGPVSPCASGQTILAVAINANQIVWNFMDGGMLWRQNLSLRFFIAQSYRKQLKRHTSSLYFWQKDLNTNAWTNWNAN